MCIFVVNFVVSNCYFDMICLYQDSHNWVMAFYRATGQAHRPAPPVTTGKSSSLNKNQGDADRARKHGAYLHFNTNTVIAKHIIWIGMEEYIAADPITFDHAALFAKLQNLSLDWRLQDPFASLVFLNCIFFIFS